MDTSKELEILKGIRDNNPEAENSLIKMYYPKIKMIVGMRIHDKEDQIEIVNDILLAITLKLRNGSFDPERGTTLSSYINGIIHNTIIQYLKNYYKRSERSELVNEHISENLDSVKQINNEFENEEETENKRKMWRELLNTLKPKYKKVMYLRFYEDYSVIEIGKEMNLTPQKVSDYIKYSKKLLFSELSKKKNQKYFSLFFQIFLFDANI